MRRHNEVQLIQAKDIIPINTYSALPTGQSKARPMQARPAATDLNAPTQINADISVLIGAEKILNDVSVVDPGCNLTLTLTWFFLRREGSCVMSSIIENAFDTTRHRIICDSLWMLNTDILSWIWVRTIWILDLGSWILDLGSWISSICEEPRLRFWMSSADSLDPQGGIEHLRELENGFFSAEMHGRRPLYLSTSNGTCY